MLEPSLRNPSTTHNSCMFISSQRQLGCIVKYNNEELPFFWKRTVELGLGMYNKDKPKLLFYIFLTLLLITAFDPILPQSCIYEIYGLHLKWRGNKNVQVGGCISDRSHCFKPMKKLVLHSYRLFRALTKVQNYARVLNVLNVTAQERVAYFVQPLPHTEFSPAWQ